MPTTTNLSILSAVPNAAGQLICPLVPSAPLNLKELIIYPYPGLPAPIGNLTPGAPPNLVVHTIFVDSNDPVCKPPPAPFTLAVTYDEGTFKLTGLLVL
jgi:hypothetical protein